jgi:hypothetical protein
MAAHSRIPFVAGTFWKVLAVVAILVVAGWVLIPRLTSYQITPADYGGSSVSAIILAYLVHLWLLPTQPQRGEPHPDEPHGDDPDPREPPPTKA